MSKFMPPKPNPTDGYLSDPKISYIEFKKWYDTHIKPLFENAKEVVGYQDTDGWRFYEPGVCPCSKNLSSALVINIQKIEPESAESILRELIGNEHTPSQWYSLCEKARKFLEKIKGDGE